MKESQPDRLLSVKEVSVLTSLSKSTINAFIHKGYLKALVTPTGQFRIREIDANTLLQEYVEEEITITKNKKKTNDSSLVEVTAMLKLNSIVCKFTS